MSTHAPASKSKTKSAAFVALVLEVSRLNGALTRAGDALAASAHLNHARWQVLAMLERDAMAVAHIAREMGLARQSVQQLADALVDDGFGVYRDNPNHARAKLVALTGKGKKALAAVKQKQLEWADGLAGGHTLKEIEGAAALLLRARLDLMDPQ